VDLSSTNFSGSPAIDRKITSYFFLAALEVLACLVYLLLIPADPKNQVIFGYSWTRLAILSGLFIFGLTFVCLLVKSWRDHAWNEAVFRIAEDEFKQIVFLFGSIIIFVFGWIGSFLPSYRVGQYEAYFIRLHPVIIWLTLLSGQTVIFFLVQRYGFRWNKFLVELKRWKTGLMATAILMGLFCLAWVTLALNKFDFITDKIHWNETGVPILGLQSLAALLISIFVLVFGVKANEWIRRQKNRDFSSILKRVDIPIFFLIWAVAVIAWLKQPMQSGYFSPGPYPPNYEYYPFSDSADYDITAQYALIGQGLDNHVFDTNAYVDKPFFSAFLVFLHALAGNNFSSAIILQVIIFASFPAILYLLGKNLHSRAAGFLIASLAIFKEINSLAANRMLQVSNSKLILTEIPTAILLALFILFFTKWSNQNRKSSPILLIAGGILGLSTLMRYNPWLLVPLVLLIVLIAYWRQWKNWFNSSILICSIVLVSIIPWIGYSYVVQRTPYYFLIPFKGSIWKFRYEPFLKKAASPSPTKIPSTPTLPEGKSTPSNLDTIPIAIQSGGSGQNGLDPLIRQAGVVFTFVRAHFLHNLVGSILILPTSFSMDDLSHTIKAADSYWSPTWQGQLSDENGILLAINLLLIALGIAAATARYRLAGLIPFLVYLTYNLSTALARTSGGRYLVPVDWVVYFYFAIGIIQVCIWVAGLFGRSEGETDLFAGSTDEPVSKAKGFHLKNGYVFLGVLTISMSIALSGSFFPLRYTFSDRTSLIQNLEQNGFMVQAGLSSAQIETFLQNPDAQLVTGRALYPRYYAAGNGEPEKTTQYRGMNYPRLAFTLIGPTGTDGVILPASQKGSSIALPDSADVIVLGCNDSRDLQAAFVFVLGPTKLAYQRSPVAPLSCPLPVPVCDENKNCR
jgi:hypothetical protein